MRPRRPSLPTVVAFLALFIALGGPAKAEQLAQSALRKGSVDSRDVKNRSLKVADLRKQTVRSLRRTPDSSVTEAKLRNGAVTPGKLAPGAVGSAAIADASITAADVQSGSLTGMQIADGSLGAHDLGRFYGRFTSEVPRVEPASCATFNVAGLAPERIGADISDDLVVVNPSEVWPEDRLSMTVQNSTERSRFAITACNVSLTAVPAFTVPFRYLVIDLP